MTSNLLNQLPGLVVGGIPRLGGVLLHGNMDEPPLLVVGRHAVLDVEDNLLHDLSCDAGIPSV